MSQSNGVIRISNKGIKKFAFGENGEPFAVDVVEAWQEWVSIDDSFREDELDENGLPKLTEDGNHVRRLQKGVEQAYHNAAAVFATKLNGGTRVTLAEALDFIARLREQWDELVVFFQPRSREKPSSPEVSEVRFSHAET